MTGIHPPSQTTYFRTTPIVFLDTNQIPKVRRLTIGSNSLIIKNRKDVKKIPLCWDFDIHKKFLAFLGYYFEKGYYDDQSVVLACGRDLPGLIQIFDYVAELFKCNYRIKKYQVVYFDSALLKYTMMGLGFPHMEQGIRVPPGWVETLPNHLIKEFLRGLLTGCSKIGDERIICNTRAGKLLKDKLPNFSVNVFYYEIGNDFEHTKCSIPKASFKSFWTYIGFLSEHKNNQLQRVTFINEL